MDRRNPRNGEKCKMKRLIGSNSRLNGWKEGLNDGMVFNRWKMIKTMF